MNATLSLEFEYTLNFLTKHMLATSLVVTATIITIWTVATLLGIH